MNSKTIHIVHLYPREMNIYGDTGNTLILRRRLEWRGYEVRVSLIGINDNVPKDADIILGGGGQDSGQDKIQADLQEKADDLHALANGGVPMLMVCGMYQLFGRSFTTSENNVIKGIGILPIDTIAGQIRFIGNTIYDSEFGEIVGYENHSGITTLDEPKTAWAKVIKGKGNNGEDNTEGCREYNVFGTYSHGPLLSKNPVFADALILLALNRRNTHTVMSSLDDSLENSARQFAKRRPR